MTSASRRGFLAGSIALPGCATVASAPVEERERVAADLERYIGFGSKQAGGDGDNACGAWLAGELEGLGYVVERQDVATPYFTPRRSELVCGDSRAVVWPQPIVRQTGPDGVTGPLVRVDSNGRAASSLSGAIALVDLPFSRWSSALARPIRAPVEAAFRAGARAVVVVTNGPSGKVIALNADGREPMFAGPVALIAPEDSGPLLGAAIARQSATLFITGEGGRRPAFNFIGRMDRGAARWVVVSTPRSGWFTCAGERGGGVAVWLWLARWARTRLRNYNLAFVCNSGHEYEYLGAAEALEAIAPRPADTHFWLHLGANLASTEWHDGTGQPLPSVDTQRHLSVSPALLPIAREIFAGHTAFEAPYSSDVLSAGEQVEILAAGYTSVAAVFGIHRYHHVTTDDARCVSATNVATAALAFQNLVARVAAG
jgi:hypothetical protein